MSEVARRIIDAKELCERWNIGYSTLMTWIREGSVNKIEGLPAVRFNLDYIEALENQTGESKTWREIQLEKQLEVLKTENIELKSYLGEITALSTKGLRGA